MSLSRATDPAVVPPRSFAAASLAHRGVLVVAHRGVWTDAPENSLAAIRAAVALGLDMVEIDARLAADGTPVVIHDATLDRTTGLSGRVGSLAAGAQRSARLRMGEGGPDAPVTDERLPTLAEALEEARGRILVNIDTKSTAELPAVMALVQDLGMTDEVVVKAAVDPERVAELPGDHPAFGPVPFMPILKAVPGRVAADIACLHPLRPLMVEGHAPNIEVLYEARKALEEAGIRLWINSLDCFHIAGYDDSRAAGDPDAVWGALLDAGVGAIQTDRAADLVAYLAARGRRAA
ncbi:glycerophosphodiester phosphodiesterase family protein [Aureimonas pseudogalii]|uniref:Glycerophosphoryl diester phosphodiesterase n=1 Tax=Aureimonas pseudogalii TaxID=1744844 RepID=A0A7W6EDC2_9HYPH|nr:glycerophosphodiester phosphodiesterase family protein [Aureimonas pseudogalii]MBB3996600.1 glycerophosphoryl diester phosphodiesterase [Aureimonas pseudogalii]